MPVAPVLPFLPNAVFLDRDGTIIVDKHYLCQPGEVELLPGAGEALALLSRAGCQLFVVTNQSGIGRGKFDRDAYEACRKCTEDLLYEQGAAITDTRHCPHAPADGTHPACLCRKPQTGMWKSLRAEFDLDPERCVMIGDKLDDVMFGINAGFAASFLVMTGKGREDAATWGLSLPDGRDIIPVPLPPGVSPVSENDLPTRIFLSRDLAGVTRRLLAV